MPDRITALITQVQANQDVQRRILENALEAKCQARRYVWKRRQRDPMFSVLQSQRGRVRTALKGKTRLARFNRLLGCTRAELQAHIEAQFQPGMTWNNFGKWHIDHIRPCCSFDLREPEQQIACFNFSNLQPLWASDNLRKSGKYACPA